MTHPQETQALRYRGADLGKLEISLSAAFVVGDKRSGNAGCGVLQVIGLCFLKFRLRGIEDDQFHAAAASLALRRTIDSSKSIAPISPRSYASPRRSASFNPGCKYFVVFIKACQQAFRQFGAFSRCELQGGGFDVFKGGIDHVPNLHSCLGNAQC